MPRIKCFVYIIVLITLLVVPSCTDIETKTSTTTPKVENTTAPIAMPTNILVPSPTTKSEQASLPSIKTRCATDSSNTKRLGLQGVIAFENANKYNKQLDFNYGFSLFELSSKKEIKAINEGFSEQVSPDAKYLAYLHYDPAGENMIFAIINSKGKTISDFPFRIDEKWQDYFNWQNAQQIRIVHTNFNDVSVGLLNPFDQTHIPVKTDWQGAYHPENPSHDRVANWGFDEEATKALYVYGANILYNPKLTRVAYPKDNDIVSLVDVETGAELASAKFANWGRLPSWSPNGEYFVIVNHEGSVDDFYLAPKNGGEFRKITNFSERFDFASVPDYAWSPDSKQIAFWLNTEASEQEDGTQSELAVMDILSKQVTRLCIDGISSNAHEPWTMNHTEPIWSPDGRYIVITQWDDPSSPRKYYVLVVDLQTGAVQKISENTAPIGWMVSEP